MGIIWDLWESPVIQIQIKTRYILEWKSMEISNGGEQADSPAKKCSFIETTEIAAWLCLAGFDMVLC